MRPNPTHQYGYPLAWVQLSLPHGHSGFGCTTSRLGSLMVGVNATSSGLVSIHVESLRVVHCVAYPSSLTASLVTVSITLVPPIAVDTDKSQYGLRAWYLDSTSSFRGRRRPALGHSVPL
ncbi:hypothetical protein OG21DRAFT_1175097 [Imleria badia]|nr:hypothetical protein OG21DRAFT_1175097 [Imleria badia]